jgi:flagellin
MLSLHTNAASLSTQNSLGSTNKALGSSMTKLGTGFRVNSAMDDAAGLQIATRLNAQTRGMQVAQKNTQNGISMLQTAEGALSEVGNILLRMKDLATEAANATANTDDKAAMQAEYDSLGKEIKNIIENTSFGGANLFNQATAAPKKGTLTAAITFQIGASKDETMSLDVKTKLSDLAKADGTLFAATSNFTTDALGTELTATASTTAGANIMIGKLDTAINAVATFRSDLGAASNRLEHTYNNLGNMIQNTEAAKGRIMDVDYATETSNMTSKQMLMQASTSMLKQSNSMSQMVASLLQ